MLSECIIESFIENFVNIYIWLYEIVLLWIEVIHGWKWTWNYESNECKWIELMIYKMLKGIL